MVHQIKEADKWVMKLVHRDGNKQALATGESMKMACPGKLLIMQLKLGSFHSLNKQ